MPDKSRYRTLNLGRFHLYDKSVNQELGLCVAIRRPQGTLESKTIANLSNILVTIPA
jgi:hypothetical protein